MLHHCRRFLVIMTRVYKDGAHNTLKDVTKRLGWIIFPTSLYDIVWGEAFENWNVGGDGQVEIETISKNHLVETETRDRQVSEGGSADCFSTRMGKLV